MFCTNCGERLPEGSAFCTSCGTRLAGAPSGSGTEKDLGKAYGPGASAVPGATVPPAPARPPAAAPEPKQGRGRTWPVVLLVVAALASVAAAGLVAYHTLGPGLPFLAGDGASQQGQAPAAGLPDEPDDPEADLPDEPEKEAPSASAPEGESEVAEEPTVSVADAPSFSQLSASSTLPDEGSFSYGPENLLDGDYATAWSEGAGGYGIGEWFEFRDDEPQHVTGISLLPGFHKTDELFMKNGCPSRVRVSFSDGTSEEFELETSSDSYRIWQTLTFSTARDTTYVRVEILDVREGTDWEDTTVTEAFVF